VVGQDGAILVGPAPGSPTGVGALPGSGQAAVSWSAPAPDGTATVTGYSVTTFTGSGSTVVSTQTFPSTATAQLITSLSNGTAYQFQVRAIDSNGTGPPSELSNIVTVGAPLAPTGASAVRGNMQATVSWTAPSSDNGSAITSYTVTGSPGGTAVVAAPATSVAVTGLTNGTSYTFQVTATNANGTGPASASSNAVIPATAPGSPTAVAATGGDASAAVMWTPPASNGGSAITGYTVTSAPGGITASAAGNVTSATVSGLTNGTGYTFTVTATNVAGTGLPSAPSNMVTPAPTVPGQVTNVVAVGGDAQATLTWTAPDNGGSPITAYRVTPVQGTSDQSPIIFNSTATSQVVTGLTNGQAYTFRVAAQNAVGTGVDSTPSNSISLRIGAAQSANAPPQARQAANSSSGGSPGPRVPAPAVSSPTSTASVSPAIKPASALPALPAPAAPQHAFPLDAVPLGAFVTLGHSEQPHSWALSIGLVVTTGAVIVGRLALRRRRLKKHRT
jgi:titin